MQRVTIQQRDNFKARVEELGFDFHTIDGYPYWDETAYYAFSLKEIEDGIEGPSEDLAALCLELVDRACGSEEILETLAIPEHAWDLIQESWRKHEPTLYGRFDFAYDGNGPAKLLEYNADTPTSLYEAAVFQWVWLEDCMAQKKLAAGADQYNSLHEKLIARLKGLGHNKLLHLSCLDGLIEDNGTIAYIADCALQAGHRTSMMTIDQIGLGAGDVFVDTKERPIEWMFKLYPWEWMFEDEFGKSPAMHKTRWLEPPWKAILSNKAMLVHLWQMEPGHPNLLPAYFEHDPAKAALGTSFAKKPIYSREGANILLVDGASVAGRSDGEYGEEGYIRQALVKLPEFDGKYPVIGSWIVGEDACGMGVREDTKLITTDDSRYLPHAITG
jgi:glutathionylspermidine synthase